MCQWRQRREEAISRTSHVTKAQNATKGSKSLLKCISHTIQMIRSTVIFPPRTSIDHQGTQFSKFSHYLYVILVL